MTMVNELILAIKEGNLKEIKKMIKEGVDINTYSESYNCTALMLASVIKGNEEVVKVLLENGADVNISNINGWTALMLASKYNPNEEIIQGMIEKGADVSKKNYKGETVGNIAKAYNPQVSEQIENKNVLGDIKNVKRERRKENGMEI